MTSIKTLKNWDKQITDGVFFPWTYFETLVFLNVWTRGMSKNREKWLVPSVPPPRAVSPPHSASCLGEGPQGGVLRGRTLGTLGTDPVKTYGWGGGWGEPHILWNTENTDVAGRLVLRMESWQKRPVSNLRNKTLTCKKIEDLLSGELATLKEILLLSFCFYLSRMLSIGSFPLIP